MVRTGARAGALASLLADLGAAPNAAKPSSPRLESLPEPARAEVTELYRRLGGAMDRPLRPGSWDLALADGLVIELDEEFHFTRYRAQTLDLTFAAVLPWASAYRAYCTEFEPASIAGGGRWVSPSTTAMFGAADAVGVFGNHGSPRGKQRAIYDAMKDATAAAGSVRLVRLSIYDRVGDASLESILRGKAHCDGAELLALLSARKSR